MALQGQKLCHHQELNKYFCLKDILKGNTKVVTFKLFWQKFSKCLPIFL